MRSEAFLQETFFATIFGDASCSEIQGVSQLLKQSDWAQIQDFK